MGHIRNRVTLVWLIIVAIILILPAYHQGMTASRVNAQQTPGANTTVYLPLIIGPNPFQGPPQLPATVTDMNGDTVTIQSVERIIGLSGDITEIIFALGLGDQVVAADIVPADVWMVRRTAESMPWFDRTHSAADVLLASQSST